MKIDFKKMHEVQECSGIKEGKYTIKGAKYTAVFYDETALPDSFYWGMLSPQVRDIATEWVREYGGNFSWVVT